MKDGYGNDSDDRKSEDSGEEEQEEYRIIECDCRMTITIPNKMTVMMKMNDIARPPARFAQNTARNFHRDRQGT